MSEYGSNEEALERYRRSYTDAWTEYNTRVRLGWRSEGDSPAEQHSETQGHGNGEEGERECEGFGNL